MASIYNTSHASRGRGRGIPQRPVQNTPVQRMMPRPPMQPMTQSPTHPDNVPFQEFQLMSCRKRGKHHVMDFKTQRTVDFNNFARPVRLHRKDANPTPYRQMAHNGNAESSGTGTTKPDASQSSPHQHYGPKTGADTSLIAPLGGATRNKQMLFKKRTKQIFLAKEDTREIKEQEHKPWILEDYDGQNSYTGTYEGGQRSEYVFFVLSGGCFKVVPVDRWYKFQPKRNYRTLTLEEAEEQLKKQQKRDQNRWMMLKRNRELAEAEKEGSSGIGLSLPSAGRGKARADSDDEDEKKRRSRDDSEVDDLDFDDVFQDDEEGGAEHEAEDEDAKDSKERMMREMKGYIPGGGGDESDDMESSAMFESKLSAEGKQMRKLVRVHEKNRAYESDDERDPYASSSEESSSEIEEEEKSDAESAAKKAAAMTQKGKGPVPAKPGLTKKGRLTKVKKEALPRPIGRPGSPSLHQLKKDDKPASSVPSVAHRDVSPTAQIRKRKLEDSASLPDAKHRPKAAASTSPSSHEGTSAQSPESSSDDSLITEEEVIATLRGKTLTIKEFLKHFKKRIKKNERNREIITSLLKRVARHNTTGDPTTRLLELRPELQ